MDMQFITVSICHHAYDLGWSAEALEKLETASTCTAVSKATDSCKGKGGIQVGTVCV